jgi:hypothetical protein
MTPLDEWSARRRDLYLTNTQQSHIHAPGGIRTSIPAGEWLQTHTLDRSVTGPLGSAIINIRIFKYVDDFDHWRVFQKVLGANERRRFLSLMKQPQGMIVALRTRFWSLKLLYYFRTSARLFQKSGGQYLFFKLLIIINIIVVIIVITIIFFVFLCVFSRTKFITSAFLKTLFAKCSSF